MEKIILDIRKSIGQASNFFEYGMCTALVLEAQPSCLFYDGDGRVCEHYEEITNGCMSSAAKNEYEARRNQCL